uniref:Tumor necrosis factor receptor superfamily member 14-like n=1 Tax=Sinocyclocheilus anshuiensis TaxID=1608454 RepID=A0A671L9U8_9TELE
GKVSHWILQVQCCLFCVFTGFYHFLSIGSTCSPNEYTSAYGECCPMCNPGSVVHSDCSEDVSTTCKPCPPGTFVSEPNGLHLCFTCKHCAESQGLYSQSKCTTIKNTICDVLDGYYCIDYSNALCRHAQKHRVCRPGQETKTPGTKTSDTECVDCAPGFYSPSGLNCTKWTDCAARNEIQTEGGTSFVAKSKPFFFFFFFFVAAAFCHFTYIDELLKMCYYITLCG